MAIGHNRAVVASSVQGWVLPHLIAWVESRNIDAAPMRSLFGRTRLEDPTTRVPETITETAWRLAVTLTGDEALGIHIAESLPRGALDLIEYALRSSPSLEKGLDRLARYGRLVSDRVATRTHQKGEGSCSWSTTPAPRRCTRRGQSSRWQSRSSWRAIGREPTSHLPASRSRMPRPIALRSIDAFSMDVFGLPPARVR